jgi:hypothetical protein
MDVYVADIWQVAQDKFYCLSGCRPFFQKTFTTQGLKNVFSIAQVRFEGKVDILLFSFKLTPVVNGGYEEILANNFPFYIEFY